MPYLITTTTPAVGAETVAEYVSHRAVATLDEAKSYVIRGPLSSLEMDDEPDHALEFIEPFYGATYALPEQGGTIGPLPDGTVIEVARVGLNELRIGTDTLRMTPDELVTAYNAAQD